MYIDVGEVAARRVMAQRFRVKLKAAHDKTGLTAYMVGKKTGIAINTVSKYITDDEVVVDYIPTTVVKLAEFYGLDWRDSKVIEVIEDVSTPEMETPLLVP
jgi:hypothetical protein